MHKIVHPKTQTIPPRTRRRARVFIGHTLALPYTPALVSWRCCKCNIPKFRQFHPDLKSFDIRLKPFGSSVLRNEWRGVTSIVTP